MSTVIWVVIVAVAVVVVAAVALAALRTRRSRDLQEQFGSEYSRVAADAPTRREAEAELRDRRERHEQFDLKPLEASAARRYRTRWQEVQAEFVDDPAEAVSEADELIRLVMRDRGYPIGEFETRAADLSVDHPDVVENYRAAHGIAIAHERGRASTEELRTAVRHYRALFVDLLETDDRQPVR